MGKCKACNCNISRKWALSNPEKVVAARKKYRSRPENKAKDNTSANLWYRSNAERAANTQFLRGLKKYGLTLTQYNQMWAKQDFSCYLCGDDESTMYIDHNHESGKVRGLLCNSCNRGIGLLKDNSVVLE